MRPLGLPRPVGTRLDEYLFDMPDEGIVGFTVLALANQQTLIRICGGDDRFLRQSFPKWHIRLADGDDVRMAPVGIAAQAAAVYFAGLCTDAELKRLRAVRAARPKPGAIERAIEALRAWRPRAGRAVAPWAR